ncbi:MAG: hypothetical protein M1836_007766 [Candelina mexicana]|nr:MAG: hypothetical protein M1836_007766 [Candelina mexicana]
MAGARPGIAFVSLFLTAGAILLLFLVILSGAVNGNPLNQIYFLQADTSGIQGALPQSRWTLWNICGVDDSGRNANCGAVKPAFPFNPQSNFPGVTNKIDEGFLGSKHGKFFYLSRFTFAFYLIGLFFAVCSLFTGLAAMFSRIGGAITGLFSLLALTFGAAAAACMTAWVVIAHKYFNRNNQTATYGTKALGLTWGAVACLFLTTVLFFATAAIGGQNNSTYTKRTGGKSFFGRKRSTKSTKSRGSFIDTESTPRGVKDEYS